MNRMYETIFPQWEYVNDCYKGVIAIKSPEKQAKYLPKFPVEARNPAKDPQYQLRCWTADYDNIFKSAIMSMVGVMGKMPAKVDFGNAIQAVKDIDVWGNKYDDRLVGLKARLNHAQTLFGRYILHGKSRHSARIRIVDGCKLEYGRAFLVATESVCLLTETNSAHINRLGNK